MDKERVKDVIKRYTGYINSPLSSERSSQSY